MNSQKALMVFTIFALLSQAHAYKFAIYDAKYDLKADYTYSATFLEETQLDTANDVQNNGQSARGYSSSLQRLKVLEAYTLKPDGRKILVEAKSIFEESSPTASDAPVFSDQKVLKVVFPGLQPNDKTHVVWALEQLVPAFPGQFSLTDRVSFNIANDSNKITVRAPKAMPLKWGSVRGYDVSESFDGETRVITGFAQNYSPSELEPNTPDILDLSPIMGVSSFPSWEALGAAYWARASSAVSLTPEIQAQADALTKPAPSKPALSKLEIVKALYGWVAGSVRYVGVFLGDGGFVPHAANEILANKYGDCKDHATLLIALLNAKGIQAEPVLISNSFSYQKLPVPSPEMFNHAIVFVPELNTYLDPTSPFAPFGTLPQSDLNKFVVHAGATPRTGQTPQADATRDAFLQTARLKVLPNGSVEGNITASSGGYIEHYWRSILAGIMPEQGPQVAANILAGYTETGQGTLANSAMRDLQQSFKFESTWNSPNLVTLEDGGSFPLPTGAGLYKLGNFAGLISQAKRSQPLLLIAAKLEFRTTLELPKGWSFARTPKNQSIDTPVGSYSSTYSVKGSTLEVKRQLLFKMDVVAPSDYVKSMVPLIQMVIADARAGIGLKKN
jgi:transglutaminase-like putative cysteine protease